MLSFWDIRDLKQTRRRRKRERHLKLWLRVSAIIFQLFKLIMLEKCVLTILELNWNQRLGHKSIKLNICHHMVTSSTQLQNRSFHVVERTRTSSKCQKMKNARAKRAKNTVFHCQICKFVRFLLPSSSWLLKLPIMREGNNRIRAHDELNLIFPNLRDFPRDGVFFRVFYKNVA